MEYQVVIHDNLGLETAEFVEIWNDHPESRSLATAQLESGSHDQYDGGLLGAAVITLLTLGGGIATNAIYDLIKYAFTRKRQGEIRFRVEEVQRGDRTVFVVVPDEPSCTPSS
jgi:hypothetical protein